MDQEDVDFTSTAASTPLPFTVPEGLDQVLFVCVQSHATAAGVPSASYGGTAMTSAGYANGSGGSWEVALFYLVDPPTGTADITATITGTGALGTAVGAWLLSGVDEASPVEDLDTNTAPGTSSVTTTTATTNAWVLGCGVTAVAPTMSGDYDVEDWRHVGTSTINGVGQHGEAVATPGNQTITYTVAGINGTLELAAAIKPAAAPTDRLTFILDDSCTSGVGPCFEEGSPTSGNPFVSANTDQIVLQNEAMRLSNKTLDLTNVVPFPVMAGCGTQNNDTYCSTTGDTAASLATYDTEHAVAFPFAVRCLNLWGQASGSCTGANNLTLKLVKNGTVLTGASDPSCTFCSPGSGSDICTDTTRIVDFNAGDRFGAFFDEGGTAIALGYMSWALECYKR